MAQSQSSVDLYVLLFGGSIAILFLVAGLITFLLLYQKRLAKQELAMKQIELNYQRDVIYRTLDAVEDERHRVARDLHDEVGASLSVMRLLVGQLVQSNPIIDPAGSKLKGQIDHTLDTIRRISNDLLPQGLAELGLVYALEGLCEDIMAVTQNDIQLLVQGTVNFSARFNLTIYRLVQELLINATKYAQATCIELQIIVTTDQFRLTYTDNGIGFNMEEAYQKKSLGLKNIETRTQMLGGAVRFKTHAGQGLHVTVEVPLLTDL
ncbi:sensor histidine kinase [Spirosoma agri]|uniref:histidine kinase n=1 Tax=Spirosoma agri TaxID=1987381 RepID=A0A6M0IIW4_9BACT|nr:ATP-binding protein [Spirosoma agri]NEU68154.1 sensor histidine kinase [Spirosoma agri]